MGVLTSRAGKSTAIIAAIFTLFLGGQQVFGSRGSDQAEMWQVMLSDNSVEHVYLRIPGGITGKGGKKLTDPKTGKVIETWGFYYRQQSDHGRFLMPGKIEAPDSLEGIGSRLVARSSDPLFQSALANEIRISQSHLPVYTWGDSTHKQYVCWNWAADMWQRATQLVHG